MTDLQLQKMMGLWKAYYRSRGIAPEFAHQCLAYARSLLKQDLPVIFDLPHLHNYQFLNLLFSYY